MSDTLGWKHGCYHTPFVSATLQASSLSAFDSSFVPVNDRSQFKLRKHGEKSWNKSLCYKEHILFSQRTSTLGKAKKHLCSLTNYLCRLKLVRDNRNIRNKNLENCNCKKTKSLLFPCVTSSIKTCSHPTLRFITNYFTSGFLPQMSDYSRSSVRKHF